MSPSSFSIKDFISETKDDFNSPTTSTFNTRLSQCKLMVNSIEENLDLDRNGLSKMKKVVKAIYNGGCADSENKVYLSEALEKLGVNYQSRDKDEFIGPAFVKFSFIVKELSALEKTLMQNMHNIIMFPLDNVLKGDLKGVKNDLKKPVDKALKEYDTKWSKIEKEKKAQAKEAGLIRTELSGAETAEEMDRERKQLQYQLCDYLIKVNEIESKKSFDLLLHYIEFFNSQCKYFKDCLESVEQFHSYINDLSVQLQHIRQRKEDEKRELVELKNLLKSSSTLSDITSWLNTSLTGEQVPDGQSNRKSCGYSLHQQQGNKQFGFNKQGYLLKKSEGKMRVKMWQKRKCEVKDGFIFIWHSDESKTPTKVNLLTCQIKTLAQPDSISGGGGAVNHVGAKNYNSYFDLVSCNRTYRFQVEDEHDAEAWISVLINSKEGALKREFDSSSISQLSNHHDPSQTSQGGNSMSAQSLRELQHSIIEQILRMPGNDRCVDCGSTKDPTWLSINFGVVTCIECSGIHREMGVHISRIQSLNLDIIGTSGLLIARCMSNSGFNDIMEATDSRQTMKPNASSTMEERNLFIRAKYMHKKYIIRTCTSDYELLSDMEQAVQAKDLYSLLQVWAEGANLAATPLPNNALAETALHYAIMHEFDGSSLHIVDFLVQNSPNLNAITRPDGNTALHYCVIYGRSECMKLLLRSKADFSIKNANGKTPLDLAREEHNATLVELLEGAVNNKKALFENVIIDWSFQPEDPSTDFSDDDIDDKNWVLTPEEMSVIRRGNVSNGSTVANRLRNSNRKISLNKYANDNDSLSAVDQSNMSVSSFSSAMSHRPNSRPSSVIGDVHIVNIDPANQPNLSSFKSPPVTVSNQAPVEIEAGNNFIRGSSGNPIRNSSRNRVRLSAGPEASFGTESASKSVDSTKVPTSLGTNRAFIAGHSRAASADISGYATVGYGKPNHTSLISHVSQALPASIKPELARSRNMQHVRNNSVDNSLVTSGYQAFAINADSQTNIVTSSSPSTNKPAIPAKPSGIVSVFVPGSTNLTHTTNNKSMGNIYGKVSLSSSSQPYGGTHEANCGKASPATFQGAVVSTAPTIQKPVNNSMLYPVPPPRKKPPEMPVNLSKYRRCIALYDCDADQEDELSFKIGETILILEENTSDENWMEGMVENDHSRRGLFPAIFVNFL